MKTRDLAERLGAHTSFDRLVRSRFGQELLAGFPLALQLCEIHRAADAGVERHGMEECGESYTGQA